MIFKWLLSKICLNCSQKIPTKKWAIGITEWHFRIVQIWSKNTNFWVFSWFFGLPKTPTQWSQWPIFFSMGSFWLQFKHILLWCTWKIIQAFNLSIFTHCFNILSEIKPAPRSIWSKNWAILPGPSAI